MNEFYSNLGKTITVEYLMETETDQMKKQIAQQIDHLKKAISSGLAEMVSHKRMTMGLRFAFAGIFLKLKDYGGALQQLVIGDKVVHQTNIKPLINDLYSYYIDCDNGLGDRVKISEYTAKIRQKDYLWD